MNRIDFVSDIKQIPKVFKHSALTNDKIKVYLNDKQIGHVQSLSFKVDLTYGYVRASLIRNRTGIGGVILDENNEFVMEEINPDLDRDSMILESIREDGHFTHFYLRTIITV